MKAGLADYVLKGHLHRLTLVVKESLEKTALRLRHEEALERLRQSEERYRIISELSSDYAYSYRIAADGSVQLDWITQAFTRITGYAADELKSGVLLPLVHPEDRALIERGREVLLAGKPYSAEIRIITKDRQVRWLSDVARPVWDQGEKRVVCIYGAGEDITGRKRAEEERAQLIREQAARAEAEASERRYRSLAEAIPQMVWTARADGQPDYHNRRWFDYTDSRTRTRWGGTAGARSSHVEDVEAWREKLGALAGDGRRLRAGMPVPAPWRRGLSMASVPRGAAGGRGRAGDEMVRHVHGRGRSTAVERGDAGGAEAGEHRAAGRRRGARLQQSANGDPGQHEPGARRIADGQPAAAAAGERAAGERARGGPDAATAGVLGQGPLLRAAARRLDAGARDRQPDPELDPEEGATATGAGRGPADGGGGQRADAAARS